MPRLHPNRPTRRTGLAAALTSLGLVVGGAGGAAADGEHRVQRGETLSEIAAANGTTVRALAEANGLSNADRIVIGQVLVVPSAAAAAPATVVHVVAPGETLSGIAARYGTTSSAVAGANGISNRNLVRIGQRLTIPSGGGGGSTAAAPTTTVHTVTRGETLASIAARHGTTVGAIVSANGISNPNLVRIGQQLTVTPGGGGGGGGGGSSAYGTTGASDGRTGVAGSHTVVAGETLHSIARQYGVTTEALAAANGVPQPWGLYAGARLFLSAPNRLPVDIGTCPVSGGASFVNDWGFPRSGGRAHEGTDLFAAAGTPVVAPVSGSVSYATGAIGGRQFRLVGDDGMVYLGSHMADFGASGPVTAGATIGYVGNSGNAAGSRPHLHFEIHPDNGPAMNPYPVVRAACG